MSIRSDRPRRPSIGLIGTYPPPYGGVSVHIQALHRFLERRGDSCLVYSPGGRTSPQHGGVVHVQGLLGLASALLRSRVDLFHAHGGAEIYKKLLLLVFLHRLFNRPYLVTIHSGGFVKDLKQCTALGRRWRAALLKRAGKIICVSEQIRESLVELGLPADDCPVIPAFSMEPEEARPLPQRLDAFLRAHRPLLVSLGYNFAPHYGFDLAIGAADQLAGAHPQIGLVIIGGDLHGADHRDLLGQFTTATLARVHFTGDLERAQVLAVLTRCDLFLRPTLHDGDSVSVREALALGLPVIASSAARRPDGVTQFPAGDLPGLVTLAEEVLRRRPTAASPTVRPAHTDNLQAVVELYQCQLASR